MFVPMYTICAFLSKLFIFISPLKQFKFDVPWRWFLYVKNLIHLLYQYVSNLHKFSVNCIYDNGIGC